MKKLFILVFTAIVFMSTLGISLADGGPTDPAWKNQSAGSPRWYKTDWEEMRHGVLHDCSAFIVWYPVKGVSYWCHPIVAAGGSEVEPELVHPGKGMSPVWFNEDAPPVKGK